MAATAIAPDADFRINLEASSQIRAERRTDQFIDIKKADPYNLSDEDALKAVYLEVIKGHTNVTDPNGSQYAADLTDFDPTTARGIIINEIRGSIAERDNLDRQDLPEADGRRQSSFTIRV